MLLTILPLWFLVSGLLIVFFARRELVASWREPVLHRPVVIIESDDWGAGPVEQSDVLDTLASLLADFSDHDGRHPVMTLGVILAGADGKKMNATGNYQRQLLSAEACAPVLASINRGIDAGVFEPQLHGMEHFWPPALVAASEKDSSVRAWLDQAPESVTEELPSPLQSRWVNASVLPSKPLSRTEVTHAVREEAGVFQDIFGCPPYVAVPPTFIWDDAVEQAWAAAGVGVIVTPGRRYESRDEQGRPSGSRTPIFNGQQTLGGIVYVVRNSYFEPSFGHTAGSAVSLLALKTELGQPALFETHRFNFLGSHETQTRSVDELGRFLLQALELYPNLAFMATGKLALLLKNRDPLWIEQRLWRRVHVWLRRLAAYPRLRKLAWLTGWILPAGLIWKLTAST
jgi:hypothetical protein